MPYESTTTTAVIAESRIAFCIGFSRRATFLWRVMAEKRKKKEERGGRTLVFVTECTLLKKRGI